MFERSGDGLTVVRLLAGQEASERQSFGQRQLVSLDGEHDPAGGEA